MSNGLTIVWNDDGVVNLTDIALKRNEPIDIYVEHDIQGSSAKITNGPISTSRTNEVVRNDSRNNEVQNFVEGLDGDEVDWFGLGGVQHEMEWLVNFQLDNGYENNKIENGDYMANNSDDCASLYHLSDGEFGEEFISVRKKLLELKEAKEKLQSNNGEHSAEKTNGDIQAEHEDAYTENETSQA